MQVVGEAVRSWRKTKAYRHERMPRSLWARVEATLQAHSASEVSRWTGISEARLLRKTEREVSAGAGRRRGPELWQSASRFVELPILTEPAPAPDPTAPVELELRRPDGAVLIARMGTMGRADWTALTEAFFSAPVSRSAR